MGLATFQQGDVDLMIQRSQAASAIGFMPRNLYFVNSNTGATTNTGTSPNAPLLTLAAAVAKCTPSVGDCIILMAGHAETGTSSAISVNVAGISIVGMGVARNRPTFTAAASANDLMSAAAANVTFKNIRFVGASASATALVDVAASDVTFDGCVFNPLATPVTCITCSAGDRLTVINSKFHGATDGPDFCISWEAATVGIEFRNNVIDFGTTGLDNAILATSGATSITGVVDNITANGLDALAIDFNGSTNAVGDGIISNCTFGFRAGITASAGAVPIDNAGWLSVNVRWSDVAAGRDVYTIGTTVT